MAAIKIWNGSSWIQPNVKHYNGSSWIDHETKYYTGSAWVTLEAASSPVVSPRLDGQVNSRINLSCYAGFRLENDGDEFEYSVSGGITNQTTWLDSGNASDVWVMWTRTGGSESDWEGGAGNNNVRLNLGTTRDFWIRRTITGIDTIIGYCRFYDAATGGNLLHTSSTVTWSAERDFEACPLCCFTPDTPVRLANGMDVPIGKIEVGDVILTVKDKEFAEEPVTGIIVRQDRPMYLIQFEDGRQLRASGDHPLHVKDKGPASIDFCDTEYKHLPNRARLEAGDEVSTTEGDYRKIEFIARLEFKGVVLSLENSPFFANGMLVY